MARINEYPETQQLASTDLLLIDQGGGVYKSIEAGVMIDKIQSQAVGLLYTRCRIHGVTPEAKTPSAVDEAMEECCNNAYDEGRERGYDSGRSQGRKDVGNTFSAGSPRSVSPYAGNTDTISVSANTYYILVATSNNTGVITVTSGGTTCGSFASESQNSSYALCTLVKTTSTSLTYAFTASGGRAMVYPIKLGPCE